MTTFHFELVSPARLLFEGPVESVVVPGAEGDMTIMANHAALMTSLRPGVVTIADGKGSKRLFVRGGFADVNAAGLTILAEVATPVEELSPAAIAKEMQDAEEDLRDAKTDEARRRATEKLGQLRDVMAAIRN
ncbi:MAG: F0F1 ATP synthase subunit epsilon [Beijerinckiaceae bacterium]